MYLFIRLGQFDHAFLPASVIELSFLAQFHANKLLSWLLQKYNLVMSLHGVSLIKWIYVHCNLLPGIHLYKLLCEYKVQKSCCRELLLHSWLCVLQTLISVVLLPPQFAVNSTITLITIIDAMILDWDGWEMNGRTRFIVKHERCIIHLTITQQ